MFWTISAILFLLWMLGLISGAEVGLWIHLFLVLGLLSLILAVAGSARRTSWRGSA